MLTRNMPDEGLVNGSRGVVKNFIAKDKPVVLFCNGKELVCGPMQFRHRVYMTGECCRTQIPLKLAWALTVTAAY